MSGVFSASERAAFAWRLREATAALAAETIASMYAGDLFWQARFGERGRRFADEDGAHHVRYLADAIESGSAFTFETYARWLQTVLTTRGMCSLHIADNFDRLQAAIGRRDEELDAVTSPVIDAGKRALLYRAEAPRRIQAAGGALPRPQSSLRFLADPQFLLSYLADARALSRDDLFEKHAAWLTAEADQRGQSDVLTVTARAAADALSAIPGHDADIVWIRRLFEHG